MLNPGAFNLLLIPVSIRISRYPHWPAAPGGPFISSPILPILHICTKLIFLPLWVVIYLASRPYYFIDILVMPPVIPYRQMIQIASMLEECAFASACERCHIPRALILYLAP